MCTRCGRLVCVGFGCDVAPHGQEGRVHGSDRRHDRTGDPAPEIPRHGVHRMDGIDPFRVRARPRWCVLDGFVRRCGPARGTPPPPRRDLAVPARSLSRDRSAVVGGHGRCPAGTSLPAEPAGGQSLVARCRAILRAALRCRLPRRAAANRGGMGVFLPGGDGCRVRPRPHPHRRARRLRGRTSVPSRTSRNQWRPLDAHRPVPPPPMPSGSTTCTGRYGNGASTPGTIRTEEHPPTVRHGTRMPTCGWCGAGPGGRVQRCAGAAPGLSVRAPGGRTTSGSAWRRTCRHPSAEGESDLGRGVVRCRRW